MGVSLFEQMENTKENREAKRTDRGRTQRLGFWPLLAVAAFFRFFDLGLKPPHFDEGINGHFVITIWRDGYYSYDPTNFHGPLYFYLCHLSEILFGRGVESFRIMNAFLSLGLVASVYRFRRFVGGAAVLAAWIVCLSPAFTFYGRYAIHETLFILGQVFFVFGRFEWMKRPSRAAMAWMALGVVILVSTKETFFIFLGTWAIAEAMVCVLERMEKKTQAWSEFKFLTGREKRDLFFDGLAVAGISILVLAALFSGFFERSQGLADFFKAFDFWSATGTKGNGHEKPVYYWLDLMRQYEWPLLIGLVVSVFATITAENRNQRLLMLAGFGHWLAYSIIPYKTPWLILSFWPLAFFSRTVFEGESVRSYRALIVLRIAVVAALMGSIYQSWQLNFKNFAKADEPYVYVQTTQDYSQVMDVLKKKVERNPEARNLPIVVMIKDPWPLPYDLSLYPKMRYARFEDLDKDPSILATAGMVLIDGDMIEGLRHVFPKKFARMNFQLRDAYGSGWALFDYQEFESVLPKNVEIEEAK